VRAQDIEPRAYSNAPVGTNFLIAGYLATRGALAEDPTLTDARFTTSNAVIGYTHVFDFWGKSAKFGAVVPYTWLSGTAQLAGQPVSRDVNGAANPSFRMAVNLYGAPALRPKEFAAFQQDLIVGVSLQVSPPWSQYDAGRLINIGTNRWSFKPELGVSKALGAWTFEGQAAVTLYTDNQDFFGGSTRTQAPLYALQGHAIYRLRRGSWASLDATYYAGGQTTVADVRKNDLQKNWRLGATWAYPIDPHNSVKFNISSGVSARTGNNFDLLGVAWQYRWGAGL
jgi:hypothetical protein